MYTIILFIKTTAAQNVDTLSYHVVRGLYFLVIVFVATMCHGARPCSLCWCSSLNCLQESADFEAGFVELLTMGSLRKS